MSLYDLFNKNFNSLNNHDNKFVSDIKFNDVNIEIDFNIEESKKHLEEDYKVLEKEGIDKIIKEQFLPWLKGKEFGDRSNSKVYEGITLYNISYNYHRIIAQYSPTEKEGFFGEFEFDFESSSDYTIDMLEAVAMHVYISEGKIAKIICYDI